MITDLPEDKNASNEKSNLNDSASDSKSGEELVDNQLKSKIESEQFDKVTEEKRQLVIQDLWKMLLQLKDYFFHILNLREGTAFDQTIEGIKKDIDFTGHKAWILIASIFIASIGLNTNSGAVIIGAMLISPLMGPILGAGLAIGTNDPETFARSIRNLATAVAISVITSTIYFLISPLDDASSEILARTRPTILDVLVAFFGGVAGIIAGSRAEKSNVIPGVAIATALMPPLCSAGYGLATLNAEYFFGAFYLFLLNSVFIWLATFVFVRYLNFPKVKFVNKQRERKYKRYIGISIVLIVLPAGWLFYGLMQESLFERRAKNFIQENIIVDEANIMNVKLSYSDTLKTIDVFMIGKPVSSDFISSLKMKLTAYGLSGSRLTLHQNGIAREDLEATQNQIFKDLYTSKETTIFQQDSIIRSLQRTIQLQKSDTIPFTSLHKEILVQYPEISKISYAPMIQLEVQGYDTVPTFMITWNAEIDVAERGISSEKLEKWLKVRLKDKRIDVVAF